MVGWYGRCHTVIFNEKKDPGVIECNVGVGHLVATHKAPTGSTSASVNARK